MTLDIVGLYPGENGVARLYSLGDLVVEQTVESAGIDFGVISAGNYGVEFEVGSHCVRSAVEVRDDPLSRLRYGFVSSYEPDKALEEVTDFVRRVHLNGIQFYDWAYRHADMLGAGEQYRDALGQTISLDTVRQLIASFRRFSVRSYGYAAVYAVGNDEWHRWEHLALLKSDGDSYALGDFLRLVDPSSQEWLDHFSEDLALSVEHVGFSGFHLDQYGYPKYAARPDGSRVDVSQAFVDVIEGVFQQVPGVELVFNNVNDFPTWATAVAPQNALYIEPWEPNDTLQSLAEIVLRARACSDSLPIVIAAYQSVYGRLADQGSADRATALTMATLFSHGATQLLCGENGKLLVDPYYVNNSQASQATLDQVFRWYDFLVEYDELLLDPAIVEVTNSVVGEYNGDLDVSFDLASVSTIAQPGSVWRRVTRAQNGYVVHLINLVGQTDQLWDAEKLPFGNPGAGVLRFRGLLGSTPRVRVADPDNATRMRDAEVCCDEDFCTVTLPPLNAWQVIYVQP